MNSARNIRKSAMARCRALLANPPAVSGLSGHYTLYDIADLRRAWQGTLVQARPSAFVIEGRIKPMEVAGYPLVMVTAHVVYQPYELGNTAGGMATIEVHVVGRMSGERDDLASLFAKGFGSSLALYNYSSGSNGVLIENALIDPKIEMWDDEMDMEAVRAEGSYDYWEVVRLQIQFLSA